MTIGFLTNIISPHQLPLARELVKQVGYENYLYVYTEEFHTERANMGWSNAADGVKTARYVEESRQWLLDADLVYIEERDLDLIEARLKAGRPTFYVSERWFKPIPLRGIKVEGWRLKVEEGAWHLPGSLRMLVPGYRRMVKRFVKFFEYENFKYLPQGAWAEKDMRFTCKFLGVAPKPKQIVRWGYFVAPSSAKATEGRPNDGKLKVLWVGRMIPLKRAETIVKALRYLVRNGRKNITLTLVGNGTEEKRLKTLSEELPVEFVPFQPLEKVREIMRAHDVFVFASNGYDGWGAVVNEAMEEGMSVLGTFETGAASTLLPEENRFHVGDWRKLAELLAKPVGYVPIGEWSAKRAAERMVALCAN